MTSPVVFVITDYSETDTVDLANGNPQLISGSFSQNITEEGELVIETFKTITTGATRAIVRAAIADLERLLNKAPAFHKYMTDADSIWIKAGTETETARRSLIYSWSRKDINQKVSNPLMDASVTVISQWTITRHPYWEALPANSYTKTLTGVNHAGSAFYSELANANDYGSAPSRISELTIPYLSLDGTLSQDLSNKIYIGYHPKQDPTHWMSALYIGKQYYWAGSGTATKDQSDSNALTGYTVRSNLPTFYGWGIGWNVRIPYDDSDTPNTLDEGSFAGQYLVLLRARVTNTDTVVRAAMALSQSLQYSYTPPSDTYPEIYIQESDTNYHLYELGVVQLPPEGYRQLRRDNPPGLGSNVIKFLRERVSGTGDLYCDSLIFIPYTHFLSLDNMVIEESSGVYIQTDLYVFNDEDDRLVPYTTLALGDRSPLNRPESTENDWHIPPYTQGTWVVAVDGTKETTKSKTITDMDMTIYPRYFSYNDD